MTTDTATHTGETTRPSEVARPGNRTADRLFATGIRNQWYAVCPSDFVPAGGMKRLTLLGEEWLLFRRADGTLHMLEDRCPHRGARLSLGKHLGDRIACWYHGVQVDGTGTVAAVPGLPGCNLEGKQLVAAPHVIEAGGAILAYFGDNEHPEPAPLVLPEQLTDPDVSAFLCYAEWNVNWRYAVENLLDPMHGSFLHRDSHSMSEGQTTARFRIRETERGFFFENNDHSGENLDWVEL
ncbi:aromatic ring-hydroxylating dioxygenase subunit alpha, partial [Streptomyces sp. NPDC079189]|uniref:aromatic ring-hydroxylating dioxygenase subunit alpha n=1 Tax=Streptomyces sp. NPDC079189 TaxID=3154514 RepID=UPI00341AA348